MRYFLIIISLLELALTTVSYSGYDDNWTPNTMRVDFFHSGSADMDQLVVDQICQEGEWPGSKNALIDTMNLGNCMVKVFAAGSGKLLYSRGYNTIFDEWKTTQAARKGEKMTLHESVRFPFPLQEIKLVIAERDSCNKFINVFSTQIDPSSYNIHREKPVCEFTWSALINNGPSDKKVDLVIMGDGYASSEMGNYHQHVHRYINDLFNAPPFQKRKKDFNVWCIDVISQDSGIDEPRNNRWKNTALATSYNAFDTPRYVLTFANKTVRDIARAVPYDYIVILLNSRRYGGGGIFNQFSTCYTDSEPPYPNWWSDYVFVHEFGHLFAGLADEYYTSEVAYVDFYAKNTEPWDPNITAALDPSTIKWANLIEKTTPVPTPWHKAKYDSLSRAISQLKPGTADYQKKSRETSVEMNNLLHQEKYWGTVGCFQGAGYASVGFYRPCLDCKMFSKSMIDFCPVCQNAIENMIDFLIK
jgi:hypothetical protein